MKDIIELLPDNWEVKKFRQIFSFRKGLSITKEDLLEEGYPVISYGQVHSKENTGIGINQTLIRFVSEKYLYTDKISIVEPGDFIFADTSEDIDGVGNCVFVDFKSTLFAGYHTIIVHPTISECYSPYFAFLFLTDFWRANLRAKVMGVKVFSITQKLLRETFVVLPPVYEQRAIAIFLHKECAQIDSIAADLEKQIALLQQYKKSLITETVTKGLDKSVPMKDSGVEWIGEIPKHWGISRVRHLASLCSGATPSKDVLSYWEGNIPWVSSQEVKSDIIKDTSLHISEEAINSCSTQLMPAGTLVMVVRSGILQHTIPVALLGIPATINQDIKAFQFNHLMFPAYFKYYIQGENDALLSVIIKDKTTVESVDNQLLLSLKIMVPPIEEQKAIVAFLNYKCGYIDKILNDKQEQLNLLMQHKKSLIYEYVTGKKRG